MAGGVVRRMRPALAEFIGRRALNRGGEGKNRDFDLYTPNDFADEDDAVEGGNTSSVLG